MKSRKTKLNLLSLSIMLILMSFCLCGCAQVNFVTYHSDDGSIQEYVHLNIDEQTLEQHGYNIDSVKLQIQSDAHTEAKKLLDEYRLKIYNQYNKGIVTNEEYTTLYGGVNIIEQKWQDNNYIIGIQFNSSSIYKKYYELLNNAAFTSKTKQVKKLFYTKTYHYGTTGFGDYSIFNRIYNYYSNTIFASISPQENQLNYSYSVSSRRIHSDADRIRLDSNGNYIHSWKVSPDEPSRQIYFYTISANRSIWIIACIGISLTLSITLTIIAIFKYKYCKSHLDKPTNNLN